MKNTALRFRKSSRKKQITPEMVINALAHVVLVVDRVGAIVLVNAAAEDFFGASAGQLEDHALGDYIPADSPLFSLIAQARESGQVIAESDIELASPRIGSHLVNLQVTPMVEHPDLVVVVLKERSLIAKIDRQLTHQGAARSVGAMAAILAHEVKNPMAGIRGAAQLLEQTISPEDKPLTALIRDEADRVTGLVDRMEAFSVTAPLRRGAVNIHEVLARVRTMAAASFGAHVRFAEDYDPSLPPVLGNRDQLTQVFLNLVKNATEAAPREHGEVILTTAFRHGVRLAVRGQQARVHLPLMVTVQDNGGGIPEHIKPYLFEPFVSAKSKGSGLGLALVAKIVGDHGGIIEFDSEPRKTVFRVLLPMAAEGTAEEERPT